MIQEFLKLLLSGIQPEITWQFDSEEFDIVKDEDYDTGDVYESYPIVHANLKINDLTVAMYRTFQSYVYLTDGNLTTITFNELEDRKWALVWVDEFDDLNADNPILEQVINYIQENYSKLLLPDYCDMDENTRAAIQEQVEQQIS